MTWILSPAGWQSTALMMLGVLLVLAIWSDALQRRIPNTLVLVALIAGVLLNLADTAFDTRTGLFTTQPGALGLWLSLAGALTGLLIFLPMWLLRALGAGDVKLLAAVGAFAGPAATVNLALCVLLAGGVLAMARLLLFPGRQLVRHNMGPMLSQLRPGATGPGFDARCQTAWRMPYALAIAGGVAGYAAWTLTGRAPFIQFW
ncbi:prepilin peptidase CpaA [Hydrogenophaga palleronii]|uniref:Prepilin peptidase CpaA n=1 Tax=Hydrogenophaga palleronii TaxID=65655 RepID=A0ABU1WQA8_9BURK|nr:prepilin peptidase [Hydrogenophaga palleronii]MDR7151490.1 prepilin peptidase CpaA [Hydrogenophaga palleronii]